MSHYVRFTALWAALLLAEPGAAQQQQTQLIVRQLKFEGNKAIPDDVLATAIATTNSSWFARAFFFRSLGFLGAKRYFDEQEFRRDVVRLQVLYRRSGFPDAVIDTLVRREPRDVYITFGIREGEPIVVTSLSIVGLDSLPPRVRRSVSLDLPLQQGDPFNRFAMQASADSITKGTGGIPPPLCSPPSRATGRPRLLLLPWTVNRMVARSSARSV
jgi:outer membrane protein assembly factor BamA